MELRHIRSFVSLAQHLNFTQAAEAVHVTQSTLSHRPGPGQAGGPAAFSQMSIGDPPTPEP